MAPTHTPHCKPSRYPGPRSPLPTLPSAHCPNQNICPIFSPAHQPAKGVPMPRRGPAHPWGSGAVATRPASRPGDPEVQAYLAALRRQQRHTSAWEMHTALLEVMRRSNPPPRLSAEDNPWANRPNKGDRSQSKEDHPTASARAPSPRNNCCFTPRPASKVDKKTQSNLTKGD